MKQFKYNGLVVLLLFTLFMLGGCSKKIPTAEEIIQKWNENIKDNIAFQMNVEFNANIEEQDESINFVASANIDGEAVKDTSKFTMDISMAVGEENEDMGMIFWITPEKVYMYQDIIGSWIGSEITQDANPIELELSTEGIIDSKVEEIEGQYVIQMSGSTFLQQNYLVNSLSSNMGIDLKQSDQEIVIKYYFNQDDYSLVKVELENLEYEIEVEGKTIPVTIHASEDYQYDVVNVTSVVLPQYIKNNTRTTINTYKAIEFCGKYYTLPSKELYHDLVAQGYLLIEEHDEPFEHYSVYEDPNHLYRVTLNSKKEELEEIGVDNIEIFDKYHYHFAPFGIAGVHMGDSKEKMIAVFGEYFREEYINDYYDLYSYRLSENGKYVVNFYIDRTINEIVFLDVFIQEY